MGEPGLRGLPGILVAGLCLCSSSPPFLRSGSQLHWPLFHSSDSLGHPTIASGPPAPWEPLVILQSSAEASLPLRVLPWPPDLPWPPACPPPALSTPWLWGRHVWQRQPQDVWWGTSEARPLNWKTGRGEGLFADTASLYLGFLVWGEALRLQSALTIAAPCVSVPSPATLGGGRTLQDSGQL